MVKKKPFKIYYLLWNFKTATSVKDYMQKQLFIETVFWKNPALNFFENDRKMWTINRSGVFFVNVE